MQSMGIVIWDTRFRFKASWFWNKTNSKEKPLFRSRKLPSPMGKWAERITIVDQYAIIRKENQNALLRFLDFLHREASQLCASKICSWSPLHRIHQGWRCWWECNIKKIGYRGDEAKQMYRKIFQEGGNINFWEDRKYPNRLEFCLASIPLLWWSEIAIPFDKG